MFKSKGKKSLRKRKTSSESDEHSEHEEEATQESEQTHRSSIEEAKELQKLRRRQHGISAEELAAVQVKKRRETKEKEDPFKIKTGGFVDMKSIKKQDVDEEVMEQIGTAFASETNRRDEDAEMVKYVELEMLRRKGQMDSDDNPSNKQKTATDDLYAIPDHLKDIVGTSAKKSEDMLSNQMLSGIPEVDLGIMAKIKNIEATEEAKQKLVNDSRRKKEDGVSLVPTNYAVNFSQHNRFNIEVSNPLPKKAVAPAPIPVRVGDAEKEEEKRQAAGNKKRTKNTDKATDDLAFDKFKKHMRRF